MEHNHTQPLIFHGGFHWFIHVFIDSYGVFNGWRIGLLRPSSLKFLVDIHWGWETVQALLDAGADPKSRAANGTLMWV